MKRLKLIFAVLLSAMCFATISATVTITPPAMPEGSVNSIVSGESYLLYNIERGYFFDATDNDYKTGVWGDKGHSLLVEKQENGYYTFLYKSENESGDRYIENYYREFQGSSRTHRSYSYYIIEPQDDGSYKFKTAPTNPSYYAEDAWLGYNPSADSRYILWNGTSATVWAFIQENDEATLKYWMQKALYEAIVAADAKGYPIKYYENIYNNGSTEEIRQATRELNAIEEYSAGAQCIVPDWNDYAIQFYSEDFGGYYDYAIRRAVFGRNTYGQTKTMSANVVITEPSTLVFNVYSDNEDFSRTLFPIDVYVNGELKYSYRGDIHREYFTEYRSGSYNYGSSSNGYRRLFTELPDVGEHRIDIVFTNNIDDNNEHAIAFNTFGIEKTPLITVNVAKAGSLGDEILRAMDNHPNIEETNIRNVRKLKIAGKLDDADLELFKSMTSLFSLDLADTDIKTIKYNQFSRYDNSHVAFFHDVVLPKGLTKLEDRAFLGTYIENVDIPTSVDSIGVHAFADTYINKAIMPNVKYIGEYAFFNCPHLKEVKTEKLENIGWRAFTYDFNLEKADLKGNYKTLTSSTFYQNTSLKDINLSDSIVDIHEQVFYNCYSIPPLTLPKHLKTIGENAFYNCNVEGTFPNGITSIANKAFIYAKFASNDSTIYLPSNTTYGSEVFRYSNIQNVVVPDEYYTFTPSLIFANCDSLKSVKLLSPTKTTVATNFVEGLSKKDINVYVPQHLSYTYQLDNYWMDFTIVPFSTTELDSIVIRQDLTLSQHDRFEGTPDLSIEKGVIFEVEGAAGMDLKNVTISSDVDANSFAQIWSGTDNISVTGLASERLYTKANKWYFLSLPFDCDLSRTYNYNGAKYAIRYYDGARRAISCIYPESAHNYFNNMTEGTEGNKQHFVYSGANTLKLVFNSQTRTENGCDYIHVLDAAGTDHTFSGEIGAQELTLEGDHFDIWITSDGSSTYYGYSFDAIYADGVLILGANGANWKNYNVATDIIPAGTGFILMTSQDSWTGFYAVDNAKKNRVFEASDNENNEFHYELQKNPSENSANRGWNLVGNPYPNYYNNHKISFAAPITLWTGTTYKAYSLRDDDIAIKPNQAIFVQCPEEIAEISFPSAGRQLTNVITDQANAPAHGTVANARQLIDLSLSNGTYTDDTRVVINEDAKLDYEVGCDAGKFTSMDANVQQIYTIDAQANRYAINERPCGNGEVKLGMYFPVAGTYTLSLKRNQAECVTLIDNEEGFTHNLNADDYTFTVEAGTNDTRFVLLITAAEVDGIENVEGSNAVESSDAIYTIDGRRTDNMQKSGAYIMSNGKKVVK